jgi:hypothetical protein
MTENKRKFKNLEDISDSQEEVHPNIDAKSYHRFIKEENRKRLDYLSNKENLTENEKLELQKLQYKFLPVSVEVQEGNTFRKSQEITDADYTEDLIKILNNSSIRNIIEVFDSKVFNMEILEELVYYNLSEAIKDSEDELGWQLCRIGLIIKWTREYGRPYLVKISNVKEEELKEFYDNQYLASKDAILNMEKE